MDDKIEAVESLLRLIRNKSDTISSHIKYLKSFNKRLELLLECFKAYSFVESENVSSTKSIPTKAEDNAKRAKPNNHVDDVSGEATLDGRDLKGEINKLFESNKANRNLAMGIYDLIKQREPITFDDLVKGIKQSKYKVIDTINVLVKERVIVKSFEKRFVYRLNK